jgi:site-specific DNA-methyltransferase (adenine-specific)
VILDPFCGTGSTLAAAEALGYASIGIEKDPHYFEIARKALPRLAAFKKEDNHLSSL